MESNLPLVVIDDLLDLEIAEAVRDVLMSTDFPWYYQRSSTGYDDPQGLDRPWLFHVFTHDTHTESSPLSSFISKCFAPLYELVGSRPEQVRASMEIQQTPGMNFYHRDRPYQHFSAVYYVIDADGNTVFGRDNPVEVTPKFNSVAIFHGGIDHCNRFPESKERCIINFIFRGDFPARLSRTSS